MDFSFDVDPELDIAIGTEFSTDEAESFDGTEEFDFTGYDPLTPTEAKPGSEDKVKMLAARYSAGVPLWHDSDCYDHGPGTADALADGALDFEEEDVDDLEDDA